MSTPRSPPQLTSRDHNDDVIGTQTQWHHSQRPQRLRRNHNTNPIIHSIQSTLDEICTQITDKLSLANAKQLLPPHPPPYHTLLPSFISGTLAFYATSFSSQYVQYKLLKMSTGTRPTIIPMTVGVVTVAVGSWMGHLAGLGSTAAVVANAKTKTTSKIKWNRRSSSSTSSSWIEQCNSLLEQNIIPMKNAACQAIQEMTRPMMTIMTSNNNNYYNNSRRIQHERKEAWMHAARICIIGLLTYKTLFRSNLMSLSPSSYTARGSFARRGIPISSATSSSFNYATKSQRDALDKLGRRFGCHTCGSRLLFTNKHKLLPAGKKIIFHGDHIPPVSVAKQINARWYNRKLGRQVSQKFYPQCTNCSNKQGGLLSRAVSAGHGNLHAVGGGSESYFHGWRMRIGHLTGGLVAVVSTVGVVDEDAVVEDNDASLLVRSSRDRIRSIQYWIEEWFIDTKRKIWNDK